MTYEVFNLNRNLQNLRIELVSDIQANWNNSNDRIQNYIDKLNETKPDIVSISGNMIMQDMINKNRHNFKYILVLLYLMAVCRINLICI